MGGRVFIAVVLALAFVAPARADGSVEYAVKAAYLYKFGAFVEWPASRFAGADAPLVVCVVGRDPFGSQLDRAVKGQTSAGRPVVVRRMAVITADTPCHIAFLGGSRQQSVDDASRVLQDAPVLTVGDAQGTIIRFVVVSNRVRFAIDQTAASGAGLTISSKLLNLAVGSGR